jgi:pimeloyl-ACP methyl ester carboxylesterase
MMVLLTSPAAAGTAQTVETRTVKVHGHDMALFVTGDSGPWVVMEAGGGSSHSAWDPVVPRLAEFARVVTCDRPGFGRSAACDSARTADRIARELSNALHTAGIEGPYIVAASRSDTRAVVVSGSGHHIARDKPDAVVAAAQELLNRLPSARRK